MLRLGASLGWTATVVSWHLGFVTADLRTNSPCGLPALYPHATTVCTPANTTNVTSTWSQRSAGEMHEYAKNSDPPMTQIPVHVFPAKMHETGPSRIIPLDLSAELQLSYPATSPNLMASFVRIVQGEETETSMQAATSESFYVIRGQGKSWTREGEVTWQTGDLIVLPFLGASLAPVCTGADSAAQCVRHLCESSDRHGGCALYWVHDEPLMKYLGAAPSAGSRRFEPTLFRGSDMVQEVMGLSNVDAATGQVKNRRGILLGNRATTQTKTLTPTLWSLLNVIASNSSQRAHKHNSVALDLAVDGGEPGTVHTKMGRSLDASGEIVDSISVEWASGGVFVTPPGWWHSHHNSGQRDAWVLPMQDAGLYTHQRTLDIRFADEETERLREQVHRGATNSFETMPREPIMAGTMSVGSLTSNL